MKGSLELGRSRWVEVDQERVERFRVGDRGRAGLVLRFLR
jgi:hypothetical protein